MIFFCSTDDFPKKTIPAKKAVDGLGNSFKAELILIQSKIEIGDHEVNCSLRRDFEKMLASPLDVVK